MDLIQRIFGKVVYSVSEEEAIRQLKQQQLAKAASLIEWTKYESHRTMRNAELAEWQRIYIDVPVRINLLSRTKQAVAALFYFDTFYCGV